MSQTYYKAVELINAANAEDPNTEMANGEEIPKEILYSQRMTDMITRYFPGADDALKLAVSAQHIQRWKSPRADYPEGRKGYHQWRTSLYGFHAETTATLLEQAGYDAEFIERVKMAVGKKKLRSNPDTQVVEDVASLTFIEHYMLAFYEKFPQYSEEKWVDIVLKTWKKMSPKAHDFALSGALTLPESLIPLIQKAVAKNK